MGRVIERLKLGWWRLRAKVTGRPMKLGYSVAEVAKHLGMFPSDVEKTFKEFQSKGLITCYIVKGQLYATPTEKLDKQDFFAAISDLESDKMMYR